MSEEEKALIRNIQTHDLSESLRLRRAEHALQKGLPPEAFALPFPGNRVVIQQQNSNGLWWKVPLGIAGGLGVPLLAGLLAWLLLQRPQPAPAPQPPAPSGWQVEIEYRDKDGSWRPIGEPVRIRPEGR